MGSRISSINELLHFDLRRTQLAQSFVASVELVKHDPYDARADESPRAAVAWRVSDIHRRAARAATLQCGEGDHVQLGVHSVLAAVFGVKRGAQIVCAVRQTRARPVLPRRHRSSAYGQHSPNTEPLARPEPRPTPGGLHVDLVVLLTHTGSPGTQGSRRSTARAGPGGGTCSGT